jgi:hypothetical protein
VPNDLGILFCAHLAYVAVRLSIESQALQPFAFSTMMAMVGLGCAVHGRTRARKNPQVLPAARWRSV